MTTFHRGDRGQRLWDCLFIELLDQQLQPTASGGHFRVPARPSCAGSPLHASVVRVAGRAVGRGWRRRNGGPGPAHSGSAPHSQDPSGTGLVDFFRLFLRHGDEIFSSGQQCIPLYCTTIKYSNATKSGGLLDMPKLCSSWFLYLTDSLVKFCASVAFFLGSSKILKVLKVPSERIVKQSTVKTVVYL
jgi:hypothetical protein